MVFTNRFMYMNILMGLDTVYHLINSLHINWIRFTTILESRIISESVEDLTDESRVNVMIIDDSMFECASSKKVELLAKTHYHTKHAFKYGFRMLTLGWSDGNTFLPINSILLSTENKQNRINETKTVDKRSVGFHRRALAQTKATAVMLELLKAAKKAVIPASYVLFDSWSPRHLYWLLRRSDMNQSEEEIIRIHEKS